MITQYTDSYTAPSADIQNIVANKVSLLDQYILMQTGQYEYTALIKNMASKEVKEITIYRTSASGYNNTYSVVEDTVADFNYTVSNQYYIYSNLGQGRALDLPVYDGVISYSLVIIACLAMFAVIFKGALFKCLRRKR